MIGRALVASFLLTSLGPCQRTPAPAPASAPDPFASIDPFAPTPAPVGADPFAGPASSTVKVGYPPSTPTLASPPQQSPSESVPAPKPEWVVRTFQIPIGYKWGNSVPTGSIVTPKDSGSVPPPPAADATDAKWQAHVQTTTRIVGDWCREGHLTPPEGTLFAYDIATGSLAVRSTATWLEFFQSFADELTRKVPQSVVLSLDILQSDAATIRALLADTVGRHDHGPALRRLKELEASGRASSVSQLKIETRSGQRALAKSGAESLYATHLKVDGTGRSEVIRSEQDAGTMLEVDPVIGADSKIVDINFALEHHYAPPVMRTVFAGQDPALGVIEAPMTDYRLAKVTTAITMLTGTGRVVGVWTAEGMPEFAKGDVMQVAFLRADIVRQLPAGDGSLAERLERHGSPLASREPPPEPSIPPGMGRRSFRVPPDFTTATGGASDPFAPATPQSRVMRPIVSAEQVLRANGVPFPPGASAFFVPASSRIIVVNTPTYLDFVEALVTELCRRSPQAIGVTLRIIEGDGAELRKMAKDAESASDHEPFWRRIQVMAAQGRVKILRTARLETRSGQRATFESMTYHLHLKRSNLSHGVRAGGQPKGLARPLRHVEFEARPTGTRMEVDPVIGPDGYHVDLNVGLEYGYAPPQTWPFDAASVGKTPPGGFAETKYQIASVTTAGSLEMHWRMSKLLGIWKPEGSPEFDGKDVMQAAFLRVDEVPVLGSGP